MQLFNSAGTLVATTKTDSQGYYEFLNLPPGTYSVHEVQPARYYQGMALSGKVNGTPSGSVVGTDDLKTITLTSGSKGDTR